MGDPTKQLINELCSLLDEATILSISSDYDLQKPEEFTAAREVLLAISQDVEAEEATGFNPSGFGGDNAADVSPSSHSASSDVSPVVEGDIKSNDGLTTTTESSHSRSLVSGSSSKTSAHESPGIIHVSILDGLSDEEKERQLAAMFVSLKRIDVRLALQKAKGDADLAMDELLNLQWLEQTGQRLKGVDGFYVSDEDVSNKKKKGQKKKKRAPKAPTPKSAEGINALEEPTRDETADGVNVEFISDRFALPVSEAMAIYERNKFSLGAAIIEILDNYLNLGLQFCSTSDQRCKVQEQEKRVPWIPQEYFGPIFDTTTTSQAAVDVIDILASHFEKPAYLKYDVSYSVVASDLELASETPLPTSPAFSKLPRTDISSAHSHTTQLLRGAPASLQAASAAKASIAASAKNSYASASAAFRKGKSDPLFRQAAAFYADRARSEASSHRQAISTEAEHLVDQQSTKDTVDLHGVTVQDGVQIAIDRVWRWWDGLGEEKTRKARDGFKVVTGLGRHSTDGKSRLRINVFKALVADGWKVEVLTGAYLVIGRRR
ncbi:hypothetical protein F5Y19DRAFT_18426 [Xylariaceae sp. FL1651]|nr:hypothetical protein F5Y19DRAFT_18426 [Xylariaceae sp. FL1651]